MKPSMRKDVKPTYSIFNSVTDNQGMVKTGYTTMIQGGKYVFFQEKK